MSLLPSDPVSQVKTYVVGGVIVALLAVIGYLAYTKSLLETQVAQQQTEITSYQDANVSWAASAAEQDKKIQDIIDTASAREKAVVAAIAQAEQESKIFNQNSVKLMATKAAGSDCEATKKFLDSYFSVPR